MITNAMFHVKHRLRPGPEIRYLFLFVLFVRNMAKAPALSPHPPRIADRAASTADRAHLPQLPWGPCRASRRADVGHRIADRGSRNASHRQPATQRQPRGADRGSRIDAGKARIAATGGPPTAHGRRAPNRGPRPAQRVTRATGRAAWGRRRRGAWSARPPACPGSPSTSGPPPRSRRAR